MQDLNGATPKPITPEGAAGFRVSPDDKWLLVFVGRQGAFGPPLPNLFPIAGGAPKPVPGLHAGDVILGWSSDRQLYVSAFDAKRASLRVDKLNPLTGARVAWRQFFGTPISGVMPDLPIFTPDGATFAYDYRLRLADLYTIGAVHSSFAAQTH